MNKKIKRFSWIHELSEAALESKLISEAKIFAQTVQLNEENEFSFGKAKKATGKKAEEMKSQLAGKQIPEPKDDRGELYGVNPGDYARIMAQELGKYGKPTVRSIAADPNTDVKAFIEITRQKNRDRIARLQSNDSMPRDINNDGYAGAEDVELDNQNNIIGDEGSPVDSSMMSRYPSLKRGIMAGSGAERADQVMNKLYSDMDAELNRIIKTAPPGKKYTVQDLQHIARLLGGE